MGVKPQFYLSRIPLPCVFCFLLGPWQAERITLFVIFILTCLLRWLCITLVLLCLEHSLYKSVCPFSWGWTIKSACLFLGLQILHSFPGTWVFSREHNWEWKLLECNIAKLLSKVNIVFQRTNRIWELNTAEKLGLPSLIQLCVFKELYQYMIGMKHPPNTRIF